MVFRIKNINSIYVLLTVLFPRFLTVQFKYANLPTRAVTLRDVVASKEGARRDVPPTGSEFMEPAPPATSHTPGSKLYVIYLDFDIYMALVVVVPQWYSV